jgi:hypothetical protein
MRSDDLIGQREESPQAGVTAHLTNALDDLASNLAGLPKGSGCANRLYPAFIDLAREFRRALLATGRRFLGKQEERKRHQQAHQK